MNSILGIAIAQNTVKAFTNATMAKKLKEVFNIEFPNIDLSKNKQIIIDVPHDNTI